MTDESSTLSFLDQQNKWDTREDVDSAASTIESKCYIETLELRGNTLGVTAGERIAEAVHKHPELKRALWSDLFTGRLKTEIPPILKSLCDAMIRGGVELVELDLSDNAFGPIGADGIERFLESPSAYSLEVLKLNNNGLGAGGKIIAKSLKQCCLNAKKDHRCFRLKTLVAGRNRLEIPGAMALADAFKTMGSLEELTLPQNGINAKGIEALAESFPHNPNLRLINLSDNTFTASGAKAIAQVMPQLIHVETLDFGDCLCRNAGIDALMASLDPTLHTSLKTINLSGNELSASTVERVLHKMKGFHLNSLSLEANNLGGRFEDLKQRWQQTAFVHLGEESDDEGSLDGEDAEDSELNSDASGYESHDEITERDTDALHQDHGDSLIEQLQACSVEGKEALLSFVDQQHKWNSREDAEATAQAIESCFRVEALELRGNTLGVSAAQRIAQAIQRHPELKRALWSDIFTGRLKSEIPPTLKALCDAMITGGVQLIELDLSDNAFGPIGAEGIEKFLQSPAAYSLQVLKLNNNGLGAGGKVIAKCLKQCCINAKRDGKCFRLKTFVAGRNRLENPGAIALADAFQMIGTLEEVTMHQDGIKAKGIEALALSFKSNPRLRVINLSDNTFTVVGARAMAKVIPNLRLIEVLNFGDCLCRNDGAVAIVSSLSSSIHFKIKEVNLSGNELSADVVERVVGAFETAFRLQSLVLHTNNLGHRFDILKQRTANTACVDLGEESDDQGSLDGLEDGETRSEETSGNEGDDENTEDTEREPTTQTPRSSKSESVVLPIVEADMKTFMQRPSSALLIKFATNPQGIVEILRKGMEGRTQEETAAFLYSLAALAGEHTADPQILGGVSEIADAILKAAALKRRWPLSASEQICNLLLAYAGAVRSESGEPFSANVRGLIFIFKQMIARGHFHAMKPTIKFYFDGSIRQRHPMYSVFIDGFIISL